MNRTEHQELIKAIITHPGIYNDVSDDGAVDSKDYEPVIHDNIYYLLCDAGIFIYMPINSITWEVHSCILPKFRGKSLDSAKESVQWMFNNTDCKKIITHVPSFNERAYVYAKSAGLEDEGINKKSFLKDGKIYDQWVLGVSCQ